MKNQKTPFISIGRRQIGPGSAPFVIAEIGINHEGSMAKARRMIRDAAKAGAECVKFQAHVIEDEMVPAAKETIPGNATESIWDIMSRCALSEREDRELKDYAESLGLIYLSTPFSRAAADRLERLNVKAYKIGSGECNNYPLVEYIARFGKPVILSTGMNDLLSIGQSVRILRRHRIPFALLHCTSMYPTPYEKVRLGALDDLRREFPDAVIGLSDHSIGNYTCFAAAALGASILEKHFVSDMAWSGPDVPISIDPAGLAELVKGSRAVQAALGGRKQILKEERPTIDFAYACVVATALIRKGELFTPDNVWVKRPGNGQIKAEFLPKVLGRKAKNDIGMNQQIRWGDVSRD